MNKKEIEELKNKLADVESVLYYYRDRTDDNKFEEVRHSLIKTMELFATVTR